MKQDADEKEELRLNDAASHLLDECRMVLPGIQALFGFQLIAVFNQAFSEKLSTPEQKMHIVAIALVVVAIALVMAPAALHRQAEPRTVSSRFLRTSSRLLLFAMVPLAFAIAIDVFLVTNVVWHDAAVAVTFAAIALLLFAALWAMLPAIYRTRSAREGGL